MGIFSLKTLFIFLPEIAKQMGIYRPRSPQNSPFYQCIADQFEKFIQVYDERYERKYGFWRPIISEVIQKYLECGNLNHGFARIRCDHCGQTLLLALVTKGGFDAYSVFHPLPWIDTQKMALLFREKVFTMLIQEEKISEDLAAKIRQWPHSGFNIHNEVEISANDEKGRQTLAQYIIKAPVSQERMIYDKENQKVIYKSKHGTILYDPLDWLASITSHIPNKCSQSVHFYGYYSNKSRGLRLKAQEKSQGNSTISYVPPPPKKVCSKKWAELIKLIFEVNPLQCPKCLHEMRIVAIINDKLVVEKILKHLGLWQPQAHSPPVSKETKIVEEAIYDYSFFDYLPA